MVKYKSKKFFRKSIDNSESICYNNYRIKKERKIEMLVQELIEKLQQVENKEQEIYVAIDDNDGYEIDHLEQSLFALFIIVQEE